MQCVNKATALLQICMTQSMDGESEADRKKCCQAEYDSTMQGECADVYQEVFNSCIASERRRCEDCMGDCL